MGRSSIRWRIRCAGVASILALTSAGAPHPLQETRTPAVADVRCSRPGLDTQVDRDVARKAAARLWVVRWKREQGLMDIRPDGEEQIAALDASDLSIDTAGQLRLAGKQAAADSARLDLVHGDRQTLIQAGADKAIASQNPLALLKSSFGVMEYALAESHRMLDHGEQAVQLDENIARTRELIGKNLRVQLAADRTGKRDQLRKLVRQNQGFLEDVAKAEAARNQIKADKKSLTTSLQRLAQFKDGIAITEAVLADSSSGFDYGMGITTALLGAIQNFERDALAGATGVFFEKTAAGDRASAKFTETIAKASSRATDDPVARYYYVKLKGDLHAADVARGDVEYARHKLEHQKALVSTLDTTAKALGILKDVYDTSKQLHAKHAEIQEQLEPLRFRMTPQSRKFAQYFGALNVLLKKAAGLSLLSGTPAAAVVDAAAELFALAAAAPALGYRLQSAIAQGGMLTRDGKVYHGLSLFTSEHGEWGLSVLWDGDTSAYHVPSPGGGDWVELDKSQYQKLLLVASAITTGKAAHLTQAELHDLAWSVSQGASVEATYRSLENGLELETEALDPRNPEEDIGRLRLDAYVGQVIQRHAAITRALSSDEAKRLPLDRILSLEDGPNEREARRRFLEHNRLWDRIEGLWTEVYGAPLSSAVFGYFQAHEATVQGKARTTLTVTEVEQELLRTRNALRNAPPATEPARILLLTANQVAWDTLELQLIYRTRPLGIEDEVCRWFRVKVGEQPWREVDPQAGEETVDSGKVTATLSGLDPHELGKGPVQVQGFVQLGGATVERTVEVHVDPPVDINAIEAFPRPLEQGGFAILSSQTYVDPGFLPGVTPEVRISLAIPGAEPIEAEIDAESGGYLNGHTLLANGLVDELPTWPEEETLAEATVTVTVGPYTFNETFPIPLDEIPEVSGGPVARVVHYPRYAELGELGQPRALFVELWIPEDFADRPPFDSQPELLDRIYGFRFYRRFDGDHPEERLRFAPNERRGSTMPKADHAEPLVWVEGGDDEVPIAAWILHKSYDSVLGPEGRHSLTTYPKPLDPADPRQPRAYSYSVVMFKGDPPKRRKGIVDEELLIEGPRSAWTRYEMELLLGYRHRAQGANTIQRIDLVRDEEPTTFVWNVAPSLDLFVAARNDGQLMLNEPEDQEHYFGQPLYQELLLAVDGGEPRDAFHWEYSFDERDLHEVRSNRNYVTQELFPPGDHPVRVSCSVDGLTAEARFVLRRLADDRWERDQERARTDVALKAGNSATAIATVAMGHARLFEFEKAGEHMERALGLVQRGGNLRPFEVENVYKAAADLYYRWGQPVAYEDVIHRWGPVAKFPLNVYGPAVYRYFVISGDVEGARRLWLAFHQCKGQEDRNQVDPIPFVREYLERSLHPGPVPTR